MKMFQTTVVLALAVLLTIGAGLAYANTDRLGASAINFNRSKYLAKTAAYTVTTADNEAEIGVTCTSANIAITLPSVESASAGGTFRVKIKKADATTYTVTATPATGDTIGFESARVLNYQNGYMVLHSGPNNNWEVEYESPYINGDYEAGTVTFYGINTFSSDVTISGTTPSLTVGDAGEEDAQINFDGNAQDFHIGLDDSADDLIIGVGTALGTTSAIKVDENAKTTITSLLYTGVYSAVTTSQTLVAADCGKTYGIATDALTMTLPATISGCSFCFANQGAAGNNIITLSPNSADKIWGTCISATPVGTVILGADDEDLINTKATSKKGDIACLLGDGTDGWLVTKCTGTWAEATP